MEVSNPPYIQYRTRCCHPYSCDMVYYKNSLTAASSPEMECFYPKHCKKQPARMIFLVNANAKNTISEVNGAVLLCVTIMKPDCCLKYKLALELF